MMSLNQKETSLLQDQKKHEELCIKKYGNYSNQAQDPQLKQLFASQGQQEVQHLDSLNQLLNGQMPSTQQQGGGQAAPQNPYPPLQSNTPSAVQSDADMCEDLLSTEKYVSSTYNTAIFEFRDTGIRQVLNHIQKEEQQHGEGIFNYMQSHGMYNG